MSKRNYIEGYYEIAMMKLQHHYFMNIEGDLIWIKDLDDAKPQVIYEFRNKTFKDKIEIIDYEKNKTFKISPVSLYMITYYGDLPFKIKCKHETDCAKDDYCYEIPDKTYINSELLYIGGIEFRKSKLINTQVVFVSKNGCVYSEYNNKIIRHTLKSKEYNYRKVLSRPVHHLVYSAWIGDIDPDKEVHHEDDIEWNNDASNLVQLSREEHLAMHDKVYVNDDI